MIFADSIPRAIFTCITSSLPRRLMAAKMPPVSLRCRSRMPQTFLLMIDAYEAHNTHFRPTMGRRMHVPDAYAAPPATARRRPVSPALILR